MNFEKAVKSQIKLSNGIKFFIIHDLPLKGNMCSLSAAIDNWLARTHVYTVQSFVDYINSKGEIRAYTLKQFDKLLIQIHK